MSHDDDQLDDETEIAVLISRGDHSGTARHLNRRLLQVEKAMSDQKAQLDADVQALTGAQTSLKTQVDAVVAALPALASKIGDLQQQLADLVAKQGQPGADISTELSSIETLTGAIKAEADQLAQALAPAPAPVPDPAPTPTPDPTPAPGA